MARHCIPVTAAQEDIIGPDEIWMRLLQGLWDKAKEALGKEP